jgi:hypothetical protein
MDEEIMKANRPVRPEMYEHWVKRITDPKAHTLRELKFLFVMEMWCCLKAYYGNAPRALWAVARHDFYLWRHGIWNSCLIWLTDWMGWTKLYHFPACPGWKEHWMRHGRKCSGSPNCQNMHCIEDSLPRWFKWITRWEK